MLSWSPILDRELRVHARDWRFYTARFIAGLVGALVVFWALTALKDFRGNSAMLGLIVFQIFSYAAMLYCFVIGAVVTVDALSLEKRQGTLGLLFLSSLQSHEIIAGKLAASSIKAAAALVATLPMLILPLLLGGLHLAQLWQVGLGLATILALSSAAGIFASSLCRAYHRSWTIAAFILATLGIVIPLLVLRLQTLGYPADWTYPLRVLTPTTLITSGMGAISPLYWQSLGVAWFVTVALLAASVRIIKYRWQDDAQEPLLAQQQPRFRARLNRWLKTNTLRKNALDRNPFYWLSIRSSRERLRLCLMFAGVALFAFWASREIEAEVKGLGWLAVSPISLFSLHLGLRFRAATAASTRLAEDRESGALELVLSTSLRDREIWSGHTLHLWRLLGWPLALFCGLHGLALYLSEPGLTRIATDLSGTSLGLFQFALLWLALAAGMLWLDIISISLLGTWLALRVRKPQHARSLCVIANIFCPGGIVAVGSILHEWLDLRWNLDQYTTLLSWYALNVVNAVFWGAYAWKRLKTDFRTAVARDKLSRWADWWKRKPTSALATVASQKPALP